MEELSNYEVSVQRAIDRIISLLQKDSGYCKAALGVSEEMVHYDCKSSQNAYHQLEKLSLSYLDAVKMLVGFLDCKDEYTKGHCERVTKYAVSIGQALHFSDMDILNLEFAALLHDIGKLAVPDEIIGKEGKLTLQEYEIIKTHPAIGYDLIKDISFLEDSKRLLLQHHERIDGKGYPLGLQDTEIEIGSKILSVADAYDAMTSSRPYRKNGLSRKEAISQLELCTGSQFDRGIVDIFIKLLKTNEAA